MPHPFDTQAQAGEMNTLAMKWQKQQDFHAWKGDDLYHMGLALRREAHEWWQKAEYRYGYRSLSTDQRNDLAASTAGLIIQTCGRLVRGGVPFDAFFVDAAWAPKNADGKLTEQSPPKERDTPKTSLLAAMIAVLTGYASKPIGHSLYSSLSDALARTRAFHYTLSAPSKRSRGDSRRRKTHGAPS